VNARRLLLPLALVVLVAVPATATAATETASLGSTTAQLSYDKGKFGLFKNVREKIVRGGTTLIDQPAGFSSVCPTCPPNPAFAAPLAPSVRVVQLDSSPDPEVVFDLFTGGAHCCFYSQIFRYNGGGYTSITHDWLDPFYVLRNLNGDGLPEFVSGDGRFAYKFGSFATSWFPPQIWRYDNGTMIDVTRKFPARVSADAASARRHFRRHPRFVGIAQILLGYTADECLLNRCPKGFKLIRAAGKRGDIRHGAKFLRRVKRFLGKTGYL